MAPTPKVTLTIRLNPETYNLLEAAAANKGYSLNAYVNEAIIKTAAQETPR